MSEYPDIDQYRHALLVAAARGSDSPDGFYAFYELIHGHPPPEHIKTMTQACYDAKTVDKGALIFAFRGSWKTTSITITFTAFRMGHDPERANLIIGVNDDAATLITEAIATIIDYHPAWKDVFPHVVPDKKEGWGAGGYQIKCTHDYIEDDEGASFIPLDYDEWQARNTARKDPSLLGLGYSSGSVIGKHPDGMFVIDDIHNEDNTDSPRELAHVLKVVQDTMFPTIVEDPTLPPGERMVSWNVWVGTPWREDDAYHHVKNTGEFYFVNVPAMTPVIAGQQLREGAVVEQFDYKDLQGLWQMNWPERFDRDTAIRWFNRVAKRGFWRMFLLDLGGASEFGIRYYGFPHEQIDRSWPIVGGVDYASIQLESQRGSRHRSYFAFFYGAKMPGGGIVIVDGVVERVMQDEAERMMEAAQNLFPGYQYTVFEADGKGEEALNLFLRNPSLAKSILPLKTGGKGKPHRIEREMQPWIANGTIRISDEDTPALNLLRKSLKDWPSGLSDPLDAVYWVMRGSQDALTSYDKSKPLPRPGEQRRRDKQGYTDGWVTVPGNPYASLGRR